MDTTNPINANARAFSADLDIRITGCWTPGDVSNRLPGNAHITIPGCEGDSMLYLLDDSGTIHAYK